MIPYVKGRVARQAHVGLPEGCVEEEFGRAGFSGRYAHLYRSHPPVAWNRIDGPLRPRAYDLREVTRRLAVLRNADVTIGIGYAETPLAYYYRNADADEVLFVHYGAGRLETDFGPLNYRRGDYLVVPRGTTTRLCPKSPTKFLTIETTSEVRLPDKGMLGQHALFDPAVLAVPEPDPAAGMILSSNGEFELRIKRCGEITRVYYPHCPIDVIGWKGTLCPWQLNVADIRPISCDRYHLPPSAHTTFLARGVAICSFLPRPLENGDPEAMKVPFYHANIDYDEVIFYHDGEFFSRDGIDSGMMTFHPQGIHHGPQAKATERTRTAERTKEVAIMIDTIQPLVPDSEAEGVELTQYWSSWK